MKSYSFSAIFYAFQTTLRLTLGPKNLPLVQSNQLRSTIDCSDLVEKSTILENFAYSTPERNRVFGSPGHNFTLNWIYDSIKALGDYYDVAFQPFVELFADGNASLIVNGVDQAASIFQYSPQGKLVEELVPVANLGCNASDYSATVQGKIALISRGKCDFGLKSSLAGAAGADAAVIYDNINSSSLGGTLGAPNRPEGSYVPTVGITLANGIALLESIKSGNPVFGYVDVNSTMENRTTHNIIAQTRGGDPNNVILTRKQVYTAHTDSVSAGPGINDNGSGTIALLQVAEKLTNFSTNNVIRFVWVSAEEFGLRGSTYYVSTLPALEQTKIRLNLNFDMVASPNYIYSAYDGSGAAFNTTGPPGSAEIQHLFEAYFQALNLPLVPTPFDGRSDYGPFLDAGIPTGGLTTGADDIKTPAQQRLFGGVAGVAHDPNYHSAGDNVTNLDFGAFVQMTRAIAHSVAVFGRSLEGFPERVKLGGSERKVGMETGAWSPLRKKAFGKYFLEM